MNRIEQIQKKLVIKYPEFASIILNTKYVENLEVKRAATDGTIIYYNPIYLESINPSQQLFLLAHEICHIAFHHIERKKEKKEQLWNIATDAVINQFLKEDGLELVPNAVNREDAKGYTAEELYEKFLKENDEELPPMEQEDHKLWKEQEKDSSKDPVNEKQIFKQNKIRRKEELEKIKEELLKEQDDFLESKDLSMNHIDSIKPLIPWKFLLKNSITRDWDWSYQNAILEYGVITPTLQEIPFPETEVLLDTSGSISYEILRSFLGECKNILRHSKLKIGCFDERFYGFHDIRTEQDIDNLPLQGGGGTNFSTAIHAFTRRVENKIIFTDGEAIMPSKSINALWIVLNGIKIKPVGGKVIYISKEALQKAKVKTK